MSDGSSRGDDEVDELFSLSMQMHFDLFSLQKGKNDTQSALGG